MKRVFLAGAFVLIAAGAAADVVCSSSVNNVCSGGGGATTIVSGTTPITGGATTQVCFNSAGTLACGDSDFTFATDRATVTKLGTTAANAANAVDIGETAGCITFEGSSADTNEARLCVTNPTVGDGTFNLPNNAAAGSQTLAVLGLAQSWTSENTFAAVTTFSSSAVLSNGTGSLNIGGTAAPWSFIYPATAITPDAPLFGLGTTARSLHVVESGDEGFDFNNGPCGTAACTNPQVIVHGKDQNTTNYQSVGLNGLAGRFVTTLTESAATSVARIPVAAEAGGAGMYHYAIYATDGSTPQIRSGRVILSVTNDGGTETCVLGTPEETDNTPTGTLTVTVTCDTTPTNAVDVQLNAVSSLTQTTLEAYSRLDWVGAGEPLPQ